MSDKNWVWNLLIEPRLYQSEATDRALATGTRKTLVADLWLKPLFEEESDFPQIQGWEIKPLRRF